MNATDYDRYYDEEYNNRARVPEHPAIFADYTRDAAAYRNAVGDRHTILRYGDGERRFIDLFDPERPDPEAATIVFVHGGYWQGMHPSLFSHLARGPNAHGITVAMPAYDLCPQVRVGDIVEQLREACRALAGRALAGRALTGRALAGPGSLVVSGHSAGGHLAACLLATDWAALGLQKGLVRASYAISGLFELKPLVRTRVNDALGLDDGEAERLSPIAWTPPAGAVFDAVVGADESAEYRRQSASIVERWGRGGATTRYEAVPGANHFTVISPLAEPGSAMTRRLAGLARGEG
jgi:arylformamidase